jgi:hypothetical protein
MIPKYNIMKRILFTTLLLFVFFEGFSQTKDSISNPLEKILQNDFDSTILLSKYGGWDMSPNFYILSKKDSLVYFYRYSVNNKRYSGKRDSPLKSELGKKLFSSDYDINKIIPNINPYFKWFDTKLSRESIWFEFQKYNLWNFIDDDNIERKSRFTCGVLDGIYCEYRLITKNQVIKLKYFEPFETNKCKYNKFRDDISKIDKTILDFFK